MTSLRNRTMCGARPDLAAVADGLRVDLPPHGLFAFNVASQFTHRFSNSSMVAISPLSAAISYQRNRVSFVLYKRKR